MHHSSAMAELANAFRRCYVALRGTALLLVLSAHPQLPAHSETAGVTHDAASRPLQVTDSTGSTTFTYEPVRKRLTDVQTLLGGRTYNVSYSYYPDGKVATMTSPAGVTLYDGDLLICELDSNGNVLKSYTWGILGLVADRVSGTNRYYLYDESAHTRALISASGALLGRGGYSGWGAVYGGLNPGTALGWSGRWGGHTDSETGLILMGARYYAPAIGRFLSRDPSGFIAGPNVYAYCWDDPVNFFDAGGRSPQLVAGGVGAVLGGAWEGYWSWRRGEGFWRGAAKGAVVWGLSGLTFGATSSYLLARGAACATAAFGAGAASGAVGDLVSQGFEYLEGKRKG